MDPFMDSPDPYVKTTPVTTQYEETQYDFHLYMHHNPNDPNRNQVNIANPNKPRFFGYTNAHDYPLYDSLDSSAVIVARAQGLHTETSMNTDDWFHWSNVVFTAERFRGSSIIAVGHSFNHTGKWAVVGGTGIFTLSQGTMNTTRVLPNGPNFIREIRIRLLVRSVKKASNGTQRSLTSGHDILHGENTSNSFWTLGKSDNETDVSQYDDGTANPTDDTWSLDI